MECGMECACNSHGVSRSLSWSVSESVSECLGVSRIVSRSDMECLGVCLGVTWSVTLEYHGALWSEWSDSDPDLADELVKMTRALYWRGLLIESGKVDLDNLLR